MADIGFADNRPEDGPWRGKNYWVSPYNFSEDNTCGLTKPAEIVVHDSTLRDGEQAPGVSFSKEKKLEIASLLSEVGVQYIEAGFPAVSDVDAQVVSAIAGMGLSSRVTCLARATERDVQLAADCGVWAAIVEVPVGYPRLKYQFEWSEEEVIARTMKALEKAEDLGLNVILFMIDTARARSAFLQDLLSRASQTASVVKISVVDTLGAASPETMSMLVRGVRSWANLPVEVHCHNDFGLATINTIAGVMAGAESFSCTVNGLGQRAGNAPLEEVVFALRYLYGVDNNLNLEKIKDLARCVQDAGKIDLPAYKPIVGERLFHWAAGIPTAALRKLPTSVEPFEPELIGERHHIVVGRKAGKANILFKLEELGLPYDDALVEKLVEDVKRLATSKNAPLTDDEVQGLYDSRK